MRTLDSHLAYYDRWAKSWEFQALLKARPIAGDPELGEAYVRRVQPKVWTSAARENFVDSVQRMRERVTEHIPAADIAHQLKLGPGGIRDIEFTVQLLQLVHGLPTSASGSAARSTPSTRSSNEGYIGRSDAAAFARDYRVLRLLEHRLQLQGLRRTHLMPAPRRICGCWHGRRGLADTGRAGVGASGIGQTRSPRHPRPAVLPPAAVRRGRPPRGGARALAEQAHDRLAAIGFADPAGALRHIAALTSGLSRKATIQRHLMPVMIR